MHNANCGGEMIYLPDVRSGIRVILVQIGRHGLSESRYYKTGLLQNLLELLNIEKRVNANPKAIKILAQRGDYK